jgi:hypothetical protein
MITIVAYFRTLVVNFIFGGRNSGQEGTKENLGSSCAALAEPTEIPLGTLRPADTTVVSTA